MKQLTFIELAKKVLEEQKKPMSAMEIWKFAQFKGYDNEVGTTGKTPERTLDVTLNKKIQSSDESDFVKIEKTSPRKFFLRYLDLGKDYSISETAIDSEITTKEIISSKKYEYIERQLHPFLAYFAYYYLRSYTKTIFHEKSEKKSYGEWIHPDMVGCYFPVEEWQKEVFEFSERVGNLAIKLFSFEIKRELNTTNLRESFFQTVSNSSWANEAYLVASNISGDEDFLNELKRLSASFGIGIISLDIKDPDSSEIMYPAENREYLDWNTMNKLASKNSDFSDFLKRVKNDVKEVRKELYDKILTREKLIESINKS